MSFTGVLGWNYCQFGGVWGWCKWVKNQYNTITAFVFIHIASLKPYSINQLCYKTLQNTFNFVENRKIRKPKKLSIIFCAEHKNWNLDEKKMQKTGKTGKIRKIRTNVHEYIFKKCVISLKLRFNSIIKVFEGYFSNIF